MKFVTRGITLYCLLFLGLFMALDKSYLNASTPEQVIDWKLRFQQGATLAQEGKSNEALAIFTKILSEDPEARGSLLMSGLVHLRKFQFAEALGFIERFRKLEPDHEAGLIGMIKIQQGLGDVAAVEPLRLQLQALRAAGKNPRLQAMWSYEREVLPYKKDYTISVQENLEEQAGRFVWAYVVLDSKNVILRRLEWTKVTMQGATNYALGETKLVNGLTNDYKIHRLVKELPDYSKAKSIALEILK